MNRVILMGRLTKDIELKFTQSNKAVCNFSIAVKRGFKKQGEEEKTDFFNVVAWRKVAEFCTKYFNKGQRISIEGRLETRTWEDSEGIKRHVTEVIAQNVYFADGKKEGKMMNISS
jgi:single-strand DNA-binding protein